MMTIVKYIIGFALGLMTLLSCDNSKSLQSYIVEKQQDNKFMKVDFATSLMSEMDSLPQEQKEILQSIKKMNVIAYKKDEGTEADYAVEKERLAGIFNQEKYKMLGKFKANNQNIKLMYLGEEDAIDEVIVYGRDDEKGLAVFRLLGDDMNPNDAVKILNMLEKGDLDLSQLTGLEEVFDQ